jgi:hypothetical protein
MMSNMQNGEIKSEMVQTGGGRKTHHLVTFVIAMIIAWGLGTCAYIYFYPHLFYNKIEKVIVQNGIGVVSGGIPVNTLYEMPDLASPTTTKSTLLLTGTNHDTLYAVGWLDLSQGPQILHVPDMANRYYSVEFVNPWDGSVFAYVGRRATGTQAGDFLITGPGWKGQVPSGMTQISSPNNSVLLLGRVLVESDSDLSTAYDLSKQIQLTSLSSN